MSSLYLVPTPIADSTQIDISEHVMSSIVDLRFWVVENVKTARRWLRKLNFKADFDSEVHFFEWDKHAETQDFSEIKKWMNDGQKIGLMSEAGLPCIADPGSQVVALAHQYKYDIVPLSGPSSIILGLISSGFNGQNFAFNGYLPIDKTDRVKKLKSLESRLISEGQTQIFMETPYRNLSLFEDILKSISGNIFLSIAANIGASDALFRSQKVSEWKSSPIPDIHKKPAIFLIGKF